MILNFVNFSLPEKIHRDAYTYKKRNIIFFLIKLVSDKSVEFWPSYNQILCLHAGHISCQRRDVFETFEMIFLEWIRKVPIIFLRSVLSAT